MQQLLGGCCCLVTAALWLAFGLESYRVRRKDRVPAGIQIGPLPIIASDPVTEAPAVAVLVVVDDDTGEEVIHEECPVHILPTLPDEPIHFLADCRMRPVGLLPLVEVEAQACLFDEELGGEPAVPRPAPIRRLGLGRNSSRGSGRRPFSLRS
jgi:hypothetical protein